MARMRVKALFMDLLEGLKMILHTLIATGTLGIPRADKSPGLR